MTSFWAARPACCLQVGFIVGLYVALASYILGTHVALFVDRCGGDCDG